MGAEGAALIALERVARKLQPAPRDRGTPFAQPDDARPDGGADRQDVQDQRDEEQDAQAA
jgi:hypothetical protein